MVEEVESHGTATARATLLSYLGLSNQAAGEEHRSGSTTGTLLRTKTYSYDAYGHRIALSDTPAGGVASHYTYGYDIHGPCRC